MILKHEGKSYCSTRRRFQHNVIFGVHPNDVRQAEYAFWCSDYLFIMDVQRGDFVVVHTKYGKKVLCVTRVEEWQEGDYEPTRMAKHFYDGEKFSDFKLD